MRFLLAVGRLFKRVKELLNLSVIRAEHRDRVVFGVRVRLAFRCSRFGSGTLLAALIGGRGRFIGLALSHSFLHGDRVTRRGGCHRGGRRNRRSNRFPAPASMPLPTVLEPQGQKVGGSAAGRQKGGDAAMFCDQASLLNQCWTGIERIKHSEAETRRSWVSSWRTERLTRFSGSTRPRKTSGLSLVQATCRSLSDVPELYLR